LLEASLYRSGLTDRALAPRLHAAHAIEHATATVEQTDAPSAKVVIAMLLTKDEIVRVLKNAGLPQVAEEAERSLPDEVDLERAAAFGARYGITRDELISRMGGSP
jgi:hypothetical protein